jgi:hypothetical protein
MGKNYGQLLPEFALNEPKNSDRSHHPGSNPEQEVQFLPTKL